MVRSKTSSGRLAVAVGVVPFLVAAVAHAIGAAPRSIAPGKPHSALAFEQYMVDLGKISPRNEVFARFGFVNIGAAPVTIREFRPSCGCLNPRLDKKEYAPGESGEFLLRVRTAGETPGPKEFRLDVKYDDPAPREVALVFRVDLPEYQVQVRPRALIFYQLGQSPITQELTIIDQRTKPLELEGATSSTSLARVERGDSDFDEDGTLRQRVRVTIPDAVPPGRHQALISISTNDPVFPMLKVPLIIEGPPRAAPARPASP